MNWKNYLNELSEDDLIFVIGPTASGKTSLAIDLAREIDGEIISADSMQIYKYLNIATAKPTFYERKLAPHHLIDFVNPDQEYSVADFQKDAIKKIEEVKLRGKIPIICGGTGLYVNSLIYPYAFNTNSTNDLIRKELELRAKTKPEVLYQELKTIDPKSALKIHPNNVKRVIRALEIFQTTGKTKSELEEEAQINNPSFNPIFFMPKHNREVLYNRINLRVDQMVKNGLIYEVRSVLEKYPRNLKSLQALGYKEFYDYIDRKISFDQAINNLKRDTRHFAKRQITWFKRYKNINYLNV